LSEDRRQSLDRRDHRLGGRRITDLEPDHGTRARYRRGCPCLPCRAANAAYWLRWHQAQKAGRKALGSLVSAVEAQRLIRLLKREQWTGEMLARELGKHHDLARLTQQDMITLRTELKVRRVYRTRVLADPERRRDQSKTDPHGLEN
jgi:hypothetical protein